MTDSTGVEGTQNGSMWEEGRGVESWCVVKDGEGRGEGWVGSGNRKVVPMHVLGLRIDYVRGTSNVLLGG